MMFASKVDELHRLVHRVLAVSTCDRALCRYPGINSAHFFLTVLVVCKTCVCRPSVVIELQHHGVMASTLLQPVEVSEQAYIIVNQLLTTDLKCKIFYLFPRIHKTDFRPGFMHHETIICIYCISVNRRSILAPHTNVLDRCIHFESVASKPYIKS